MENMDYNYGDWYTDDNGIMWEFNYDIPNQIARWFQVDPQYYIPEGREVPPCSSNSTPIKKKLWES